MTKSNKGFFRLLPLLLLAAATLLTACSKPGGKGLSLIHI